MEFGIVGRAAHDRRHVLFAFVAAAAVCILAAGIRPIGYIGAGWDDEQYLAAARCWVEHRGACVPHSHWWTRWPLVAPMAAFLHLFGDSRLAAELAPALWWALALGMTGWLGTRWFGWRAGAIALALLGTAPVIAFNAFDPNIDIPELALQLSALAVATSAYRRQSRVLAVFAGVLAGLALQARETSSLFLLASAILWFTLPGSKRNILLWAVAGVASVELAEMLVYAIGTGDPILRMRLALGHTDIVTNQLGPDFHSDRGPLLNADYIRSWKREMLITVWWPIDPWLNLLASPQAGRLLACGGIALAGFSRRLSPDDRRSALRLLCGGGMIAVGLVYVLAIDPKTRMMLSLIAAVSIASGAALSRGLRSDGKPLAAALLLIPILTGLYVMSRYETSARVEARATEWFSRHGQDIEISRGAASYLTFVPGTRSLPAAGSGRRYLVTTAAGNCGQLIEADPQLRLIDEVSVQGSMCLLEYPPERLSVARSRRP